MASVRRLIILGLWPFATYALTGCSSGSEKIAEAVNAIRAEAAQIERDAHAAAQHVQDMDAIARPELTEPTLAEFGTASGAALAAIAAIDTRTSRIVGASDQASANLTKVRDNESQFMRGLRFAAYIIAPVAVLIILWQTGALGFIRGLLGLVTVRTKQTAIHDAEALESNDLDAWDVEKIVKRAQRDAAYRVILDKARKRLKAGKVNATEVKK